MASSKGSPAEIATAQRDANHEQAVASVLMLLTTFFWAGNIVAGKFALTGFDPLALAQVRMAAAAILYSLLFLLLRGRPSIRLTRRQWLIIGLMALTGITLNQIFYIGGLARTSVTHTGLIQTVVPVMVLVLSGCMGMEVVTRRKLSGMGMAFAGVTWLVLERAPRGSGAHWSGDVMLVVAESVFAYYTILTKEVAHLYDTLTLNMLVFGLGAVLLIPFCAKSVSQVRWHAIPAEAWWGLAFMIVFGSLIAYLIYAFALTALAASRVAAFSYLQPVMAAAMGVWLIGERISPEVIGGGLLILLGVYLTEHERGERKHIHHLACGKV